MNNRKFGRIVDIEGYAIQQFIHPGIPSGVLTTSIVNSYNQNVELRTFNKINKTSEYISFRRKFYILRFNILFQASLYDT